MIKSFFLLSVIILFSGCGLIDKKKPRPDPTRETTNHTIKEVQNRFFESKFWYYGWLVSEQNKAPHHLGDSGLWMGVALGSLPCEDSYGILDNITQQIEAIGGGYPRHPAEDKPPSFDTETGLIFGFSLNAARCPENRDQIRLAWNLHRQFTNDGENIWPMIQDMFSGREQAENIEQQTKVYKGFKYAFDLLSWFLEMRHKPDDDRRTILEALTTTWALGVVASKSACYRIHLSQLYYLAVEALDQPLESKYFCTITENAGLPLTDWFCGRIEAKDWLDYFEFNRWENQNQRCSWESEDNSAIETPGIDYITLYYMDEYFGRYTTGNYE